MQIANNSFHDRCVAECQVFISNARIQYDHANQRIRELFSNATASIRNTIDSISRRIHQDDVQQFVRATFRIAQEVALRILNVIGYIVLFCANPVIFPISFAFGFCMDAALQDFGPTLTSIENRAQNLRWPALTMLCIGSLYAPVATVAIASCFFGMRLGTALSHHHRHPRHYLI